MTRDKKLILFDFDGVIVDSFSISFGMLKEQNPQVTEQDYRACFEGNFFAMTKRRTDIKWRSKEEFFPMYSRQLLKTPPVPGIIPVLEELSQGFVQVIVSATIRSPIEEYLDAYGLR